jgi:hypothetical protein
MLNATVTPRHPGGVSAQGAGYGHRLAIVWTDSETTVQAP